MVVFRPFWNLMYFVAKFYKFYRKTLFTASYRSYFKRAWLPFQVYKTQKSIKIRNGRYWSFRKKGEAMTDFSCFRKRKLQEVTTNKQIASFLEKIATSSHKIEISERSEINDFFLQCFSWIRLPPFLLKSPNGLRGPKGSGPPPLLPLVPGGL